MRIEIICTGDEVLTGKIVNTNFSYMAQKLEDFGLSVSGEPPSATIATTCSRPSGWRASAPTPSSSMAGSARRSMISRRRSPPRPPASISCSTRTGSQRMEDFFRRRIRVMPPNNRKQAMLPATAEMLDNPIGTACGFALDIGKARFFFTPGVPRELRRMLEEQIIPRLLARAGVAGRDPPEALSFLRARRIPCRPAAGRGRGAGAGRQRQARLPRALPADRDQADRARRRHGRRSQRKLAPVKAEVRRRLGNFILAEDDQTLEGVVLAALTERDGRCGGRDLHRRPDRRPHRPPARRREGLPARHRGARPGQFAAAFGLDGGLIRANSSREAAEAVARAAREETGASHALAVLIELDEGPDRIDFGGTIWIAIATADGSRPAAPASWAGANGSDWARSNWASTACAASSRACRWSSASTSSALTAADRAPASAMNSARRPSEAERGCAADWRPALQAVWRRQPR